MSLVWPSWRYRRHPETGEIEKRIFNSVSEAMNAGEGWVSSPADIDSAKALSPVLIGPEPSNEPFGRELGVEPSGPNPATGEIDFSGLDDVSLREIATNAGVKVDKRWGRARLEAELRNAK
jgi:hypothetical protein